MVWDVYQREDGVKVARCLQMTSFGKRGVEGKYDKPHVWAFHCQYLPVGHGGTKSRTNQPILELQDGEKMETQSYVHLDHFFEIEARYLVAWGRGRYPVPMGLTSGALDVLRAKLGVSAVSGALAAMGGVLYASFLSFIDPTSFEIHVSVLFLTMLVVGGARTLIGSPSARPTRVQAAASRLRKRARVACRTAANSAATSARARPPKFAAAT